MPTMETTGAAVAAARSLMIEAVDQFKAGQLTPDQLTDAIDRANGHEDAAIAAVPAPACPAWCTQPAGHPYDTREDFDDPRQLVVSRWHKRTFYGSQHFELFVEAQERATADGVVVDEPRVSTIGELEQVGAQDARVVASALAGAAELLDRVGGVR